MGPGAFALLDVNSPAADLARRPETFYRLLLHNLDKEVVTKTGACLHGINFMGYCAFCRWAL